LVHVDGHQVATATMALTPKRILFAARSTSEEAAAKAIEQMRFALAVDDDFTEFHEDFRDDPLLGRVIKALPHLRIRRNPQPWEALAWAITEQLIEVEEAQKIQRRMVWKLGSVCPHTGLRDAPGYSLFAGLSPAMIESCGLSHGRSLALRRAAIEVHAGRVDLYHSIHEYGWQRLLKISGVGPWTIEKLALHGQGRYDQLPAGDLAYIKLIGRIKTGNPKARAEVEEVREFFAPYGKWKGLAGFYALVGAGRGMLPGI
jgi:3-methyladenine DNA glycosylase/8-oxoguanine DNA glycosylase